MPAPSTSVGGVLIFMCGGVISVVINLASEDLTTALALCFLILSAAGLGLNALISRRTSSSARNVELITLPVVIPHAPSATRINASRHSLQPPAV